MIKKNDLVKHDTGITGTVLKTYIDGTTKKEYVQVLAAIGIIYDKLDNFIPVDAMLLRCNSCGKEEYETNIDVNIDNGMYICSCGSSTFTALNIDLEELENVNY